MTASRAARLAAAGLTALALGACSGGEPSDHETGPQPPATEPSSTPAPQVPAPETTSEPTSSAPQDPGPRESDSGGNDSQQIPTDAVDYADAFVIAWGNGNAERMAQLSTPEVIDDLPDSGGAHWGRTAQDSGAGSTFITYENTESGETLEVRVRNQDAGTGHEHAVVEVR